MAADTTVASFPTYAELTQTHGWAATAPATIRPAASPSLGGERYTEGAVLGVGGMGKVVLARDARVGRDVAVKVMHGERELSAEDRARFLREAQVQGQLEHPSIVPVYDIDTRPDGSTFFTMRRVLGRTLHAILDDLRLNDAAARARYTQRELLTAFATVCLTIDYAHSRGVIHRDLKPANIMLGDFGEVYVLDWGLARLVDGHAAAATSLEQPAERLSVPGNMMGTPLYMAPEQIGDPDVGPAADVFSLGAILFEILTLHRARDASALFAPVDARPSVRTPELRIAPELEALCVKATEHDPADRYATPRALHDALVRYLEGDRDRERRRLLAEQHVDRARAALATEGDDRTRGLAVTELGRAVALDPGNDQYFAMLGELLSAVPERVPQEVAAQIAEDDQRVIRVGAKHSASAILSWWLFLPILWWVGFHDGWLASLIAVPGTISIVIGLVMMRMRKITNAPQYASITFMMLASLALSRIYGPYILMPSIVTTYAMVLQAHPHARLRVVGAVAAAITMLVAAALEITGALAPSYVFDHGTWTVVPHLVELPAAGTHVMLMLATLGVIVVPCLFIAKLRKELSRAQLRLATQAWHFKQLGARLIGRPEAG